MIAAFTSICEEDARYIDQYLREIDRMDVDFTMHFDKCSDGTKEKIKSHPRCIGFTENNNQEHHFDERDKQGVLDILVAKKYVWAVNWDMDETWEREAPSKLRKILEENTDAYVLDYTWVCLWDEPKFYRNDGPLAQGHRTRIYNLSKEGVTWVFYAATINGAATFDGKHMKVRKEVGITKVDLICVHWGYLTREERVKHKERWDFLYGRHTGDGKNPYGFWDWALEDIQPSLVEHDLF